MAEEKETSTNFLIRSGGTTELVHEIPSLYIRLPIDPSLAKSKDDKFTLTSSDGTYEKVLTIKDDKVDGDEFVDLVFDNLKAKLKYSLEVDPGKEGSPYKLFEDVPYNDLIDYYSLLEEGDELEDEEDDSEDDSDSQSDDEPDWDDEGDGGSEYGGDTDDDDEAEDVSDEDEPEEDGPINWDAGDPKDWDNDADTDSDSEEDDNI